VWPERVAIGVPSLFHNRTLKSDDEKSPELLASNLPSGDHASSVTGPLWPVNTVEDIFEAAVGVGAVVARAIVDAAVGLAIIVGEAGAVGLTVEVGAGGVMVIVVETLLDEGILFGTGLTAAGVLSPHPASKITIPDSNSLPIKFLSGLSILTFLPKASRGDGKY
jgi:hypothetical protein